MAKQVKKYSEEIQRLLKQVCQDCESEDRPVRERQIRKWRQLKLLWEGFSRIWYSEIAHDWRIWDEAAEQDSDQGSYDKPINVFKAYLESIIAALSVAVPPVKCFPDNADDTLDLATAKAGDKIGQLIYRHNNASLLWLHALFISVTEGMTACYNHIICDESFGTYDEKEYEDTEEEHDITTCSNCGYTLDSQPVTPNSPPVQQPSQSTIQLGQQSNQSGPPPSLSSPSNGPSNQFRPQIQQENQITSDDEKDEFDPDDEDVKLHAELNQGKDLCPACMAMMDPEIQRHKFIVTRLVNVTKVPKSRVELNIYGGLNVKIANYARKQKDTPYLICSYETDYSMAIEEYDHLHDNEALNKKLEAGNQGGAYSQYDQWGRLSPQYQGEYPTNVVTVNNCWLRPAKFNILPSDDAKKLKKLFPDGAKVVLINDEYAEACNESLDDHWTLSENPLSDYLHYDPAGQGLVSVQEITNDLISLIIQTIEHGIGQTFADPGVMSFKSYEQTEVTPGGIFPATPKSGKSLADGFHELRTAQLSPEVMPFYQALQSMGQLTSGATPSIFGGQLQGVGGETASGYSMSRAQALQRLQNTWKIYTTWWKTIFGKVIPMYIKEVQDDERDVQKDNDGNFVNVLIRKAELEGKIGKVELEANENLPMTWGQIKDTVEKLLINPTPEISKIFSAPENIGLIHDALGLTDFYVPGEDDMVKQYDEIKLLLNSEPIQTGNPQDPEAPSIDVDPVFDNNAVEFEICRKWIVSEAGRQTKIDNENGYRNVLLHGRLHHQAMMPPPPLPPPAEQPRITLTLKGEDLTDPQVRQMFDRVEQLSMLPDASQQVPNGNGAAPLAKPTLPNNAPIGGEQNVPTIQ